MMEGGGSGSGGERAILVVRRSVPECWRKW